MEPSFSSRWSVRSPRAFDRAGPPGPPHDAGADLPPCAPRCPAKRVVELMDAISISGDARRRVTEHSGPRSCPRCGFPD